MEKEEVLLQRLAAVLEQEKPLRGEEISEDELRGIHDRAESLRHELQRLAGTASVAARREQDLIPLLPPPPVLGRPNDAGAQATQQLRMMALFRDHAPDLAEGRGAPLPLDTWAQLAAESHVPRSLVSRLLPHWQEDHDDGPAVLKQVDRDRYTLGDAHAAARTFLEDGGRRSLDSSEAGHRSAAKRAAARRKVGQK